MAMLIALALIALWPASARSEVGWVTGDGAGEARVHRYFFWSQNCPHCRNAQPFVEGLDRELEWLELHAYELTSSRDNIARYIDMAGRLGHDARSVPAFFACGICSWSSAALPG